MGTDIHLRAQRRVRKHDPTTQTPDDDAWEDVPDEELGLHWSNRNADGTYGYNRATAGDRDYELFARLAGVRNGRGFAGVDRHEPVVPLFEGRGLPDGIDPDGECEYEPGLGDHSHTWATFAELLAADWSTEYDSVGLVRLADYREWRAAGGSGPPREWVGDVNGPRVLKMTAEQADLLDRGDGTPAELAAQSIDVVESGEIWVKLQWRWRPLEGSGFVTWVRSPAVAALVERHGGDNLRLLIGFDS